MKNKRILILGGSRFIGYLMLCELLRDGYDVTIFNRQKRNPPDRFPRETKFVRGDRNSIKDIERLFQINYDVVIDLSGYIPNHIYPIVDRFRSRIGQYIFISSPTVYSKESTAPFNEQDSQTLDKNTYGGNKALCEKVLKDYFERHQFPITIFRPQGVFGPYDTCQIGQIFYRLTNKLPIVFPKVHNTHCGFLYVYDLIRATTLVINNPATYGKTYNLAGDESLTLSRLAALCGEICSTSPIFRYVDSLDELSEVEIMTKKRHAGILIDWPERHEVLDTTHANNELRIDFTNIELALRETYSWLIKTPNQLNYFRLRGERRLLNNISISFWEKRLWKFMDWLTNCVEQFKRFVNGIQWIHNAARFIRYVR